MVVRISPLKRSNHFPRSSQGAVRYLEKENKGLPNSEKSFFFDQRRERIHPPEVIAGIDNNRAGLARNEPLYHSVIISPSHRELSFIRNDTVKLKSFTREVMKQYARSFHREISRRPVTPGDILYYAKIENNRRFTSRDREVKENRPFLEKIRHLEKEIAEIKQGDLRGDLHEIQQKLSDLRTRVPHSRCGHPVEKGMLKEGLQTHIHVLVSRKDVSNTHTLSPATPFRFQEYFSKGKRIRKGFERDRFYQAAEKAFDRMFAYNRNFAESYQGRKLLLKDPKKYFKQLQQLPVPERKAAMAHLRPLDLQEGMNISAQKVSLALRQVRKLLATVDRSSSIIYE